MNNTLRAFVQLNASGKVIPGTLTYCYVKPKVGSWKEVELRNTLSPYKMKPFVNTYNGKPVPGSLVVTYKKPTPLGNKYKEVCQEPASCNVSASNWYLRELYAPAINPGDITFPDHATGIGSLSPNLVGDYNGSTLVTLYINVFDIEGVDRTDLLGQLVGGMGTITLTQGTSSVTYSYNDQAFYYTTINTPNDNVAFDPFTLTSQIGALTVFTPASGDFNLTDSIQISVVSPRWYEIAECYGSNVIYSVSYPSGTYSLDERVTTTDFGGNWVVTNIFSTDPGGSQYSISSLSRTGCPVTTTTTTSTTTLPPSTTTTSTTTTSTTSTTSTTTTTTSAPIPPPNPVVIGSQTWADANLQVVTFSNGDPIPQATNATELSTATGPMWAYAYFNPTYSWMGKMYNMYAIRDPRGLAPTGWHIPSVAEWTILQTAFGGPSVAGGALKEVGTTHWVAPNTGATNSSGFTAVPTEFSDSSGSWQNSPGTLGPYVSSDSTTNGNDLFWMQYDTSNFINYFNIPTSNNITATAVRVIQN